MSVSSTVAYQVSLRPPQHELQVEMTLRGQAARGTVKLQIPTWVPGDYGFAPQARDLFDVKARCGSTGKALAMRRDGWQGYVVEEGVGEVHVSYTASAWGDDLSESAGLVDDQLAIVLGARYLFAPTHLGSCDVHYQLPPGWAVHHPSARGGAGRRRPGITRATRSSSIHRS